MPDVPDRRRGLSWGQDRRAAKGRGEEAPPKPAPTRPFRETTALSMTPEPPVAPSVPLQERTPFRILRRKKP